MNKILIIEDEPSLNKAYEEKLKPEYELSFAIDGPEASQMLKKDTPDLVLLDIMLPGGKNGYDLLREIRQNPKTQKTPVIIVTNLPESERQTAMAEGATEFLLKANTSLEEIVAIIKKHLPA